MVISPLFDGFDCFLRKRLNFDEPLLGEARLDNGSTAVAFAEREGVVFFGDEKSLILQIGEDALSSFISI